MYKECECCGKKFYISSLINVREWFYKVKIGNTVDSYKYFCSYTCWRKKVPKGTRRYKRL